MLTPRFTVEQDFKFVYINIRAPYTKITVDSEPEVLIDGNEFKFYAKPYYLRLHLPGVLTEDGQESATYESGNFKIRCPKLNKGENFEGLDLLTKLLTFPKKNITVPKIEVLESPNNDVICDNDVNDNNMNDGENDDDEWHFDQKPEEMSINLNEEFFKSCYGFANSYTGFLDNVQEELNVFDIRNVNSLQMSKRREMRIEKELQDFNEDYYLADYFQCDQNNKLIAISSNYELFEADWSLNEEEKDVLLKLPCKEYVLDNNEKIITMCSLIDILFAFAYNYRTTEGENTVESGWTISKISATLSWLDYFNNLKEVMIACFRRCLIYPLYRNFTLCQTVQNDVLNIIKKGQLFILKCLIGVRGILMDSDDRYILNELYILDYCVWVQSLKPEKFNQVANEMELIVINKSDLGLDLEVLEAAGHLAINYIDTTIDAELSCNDSDDESSNDSDDESNEESPSYNSACYDEY